MQHRTATGSGSDRADDPYEVRLFQRQRNKRGGQRDARHAFIADAGSSGKPGGRSTPRGAINRGGRGRGGRGDRDGNGGEKGGEKKDGQTTNINASDGNVDGKKGGNARCNRCGEAGHKTVRCPGQVCSVCDEKGHSAKICANVVTVFACEADASDSNSDGVLAEKSRAPSSAIHQASFSTSLVNGVQVRSHGRWGISR